MKYWLQKHNCLKMYHGTMILYTIICNSNTQVLNDDKKYFLEVLVLRLVIIRL